MKEVLPGIFQWSVFSEEKGYDFNGHLLVSDGERVLIDPPPLPEADLARLKSRGPVSCILLTNRDHVREAAGLREQLAARVLIHELDAPLIELKADGVFRDGDRLPGGLEAVHVPDNKSPGETALYLSRHGGVMILGDALIGKPPGTLNLMPADKYADVAKARQGLRALTKKTFEAVLVGDGVSILKDGRKAVERFLQQA